jgi:Protein of unknown function (DUF1573)
MEVVVKQESRIGVMSILKSGIVLAAVSFSIVSSHCLGELRGELRVAEKKHDFGRVTQGQVVSHEFILENTGTADIVIQRVAPSCGCTAAAPSSNTIRPAEKVTLKVDFDTSGFSGEKTKSVDVFTNDRDMPQLALVLRGTIMPRVEISPERLDFGDLAVNSVTSQELEREIEVTASDEGGSKIIGAQSFSKYLKVEKVGGDDRKAKFRIQLDPTVPRGPLRDRVVVEIAADARRSVVNVPVLGFVIGTMRVNPATVSFGVIDGQGSVERRVKVENLGQKPVKIESVRTDSSAVTATVKEVAAGKSFVVSIVVDPARLAGNLKSLVEIETDQGDESKVTINVFGVLPPR